MDWRRFFMHPKVIQNKYYELGTNAIYQTKTFFCLSLLNTAISHTFPRQNRLYFVLFVTPLYGGHVQETD